MPTPITLSGFYEHYNLAETMLASASQEQDSARQHSLALIAQGYAMLAHIDGTWLHDTGSARKERAATTR